VLDLLWAGISIGFAVSIANSFEAEQAVALSLLLGTNLLTAGLFLSRRPARAVRGGIWPRTAAVASMVTVYLYESESTSPGSLAEIGARIFQLGVLLCFVATLNLGRNFAVMPSFRGLCTTGLYRVIRHPLYASYLIVDLGFLAQIPNALNGAVFVASLALLVARIRAEEQVLAPQPGYGTYCDATKYRLIPFVW
jgi:protein-S-isoprenylcysteine O-methyltransferase Ste14